MSVTIEGVLSAHAEARVTGVNRAAVLVLMVNAGPGMPFEVRYETGDSPEAHIRAATLANTLRRGDTVVATGELIEPRGDHGRAVLVLRRPRVIRVGDVVLL